MGDGAEVTDIKISIHEASWVSSLSTLGFPVGALLSSVFIDLMGKKWATVFGQAGSYFLGYSLITFAVNVQCIYAGRFLCGICQVSGKICEYNIQLQQISFRNIIVDT